jgi:kynurenine 3-monooxygenase
MKRLIVIGAGLSGTLLAIRLAQRGFAVDLYESRPDMRQEEMSAGRSINLALSDRGIGALKMIGLHSFYQHEVIPMYGRMLHPLSGKTKLSPYSGREGEHINSASRGGLNIALLNEAEKYDNLNLHFNVSCLGADFEAGTVQFKNRADGSVFTESAAVIFGADGAGSALRRSMLAASATLRFQYEQKFLHHGYKELTIHPGPEGEFQIEKNALHIWPRGTYMMIALPNLDASFTLTLFQPFRGENGFDHLDTPEKVQAFFEAQYPDSLPYLPHLTEEFFTNPTSSLGMVKCYPWQVNHKFLLVGDSAHAIVPFYGQGMNCAFEDVLVLDQYIEQFQGDWNQVLPAYQQDRKADTDAICDLAIDNFYEMRDHVANPVFARKRGLETQLEQQFPDYFSKYSLVTFREDLPYAEAMRRGRRQDKVLMELCENPEVENWSLEAVFEHVRSALGSGSA